MENAAAPSVTTVPKTPRVIWLYLVGVALVGTYAAMFIPAASGDRINPNSGMSSLLWSGLFFYLHWKRNGRKGWQGALLGIGVGLLAFFLAAFVGGYVRASGS